MLESPRKKNDRLSMRRASLSLCIAIVGGPLLGAGNEAQALGFGRSVHVSHLGQPLNFAASVRLDADESLTRECVTAEVLSGDFRVAPSTVRVSVEPAPSATALPARPSMVS